MANYFSSRIAELEAYRTMCRDQMISIERILEQNVNEQVIQKSTLLSIKATHLALLVNVNHIIDLVKSGKAVIPETNDSARKMKSMNNINNNKVAPQHKPLSRMNSVQIAKEIPPKREISTKSNTGYASDDTQTTTRTFKADLDVTSDCDEWHDADDFKLSVDSGEEAMESRADTPVSVAQENTETPAPQKKFRPNSEKDLPFGHYDIMEIETTSNLFPFVDTLAEEQLKHALAGVEDNVWTLFAEDGAMKMYTREIEEGGLPVDPLKAVHQVKGVTALEFMHYFFDARYKKDWDHTLDSMSIVEVVARDTVVLHQKHKTVWPAAPRESLFVSHIRRVDNFKRDGAHDLYIVCNRNLERPDVPLGSSSSVRVGLTVSMVCETIVKNDEYDRPLTRDDVTCNIIYVSQVHPGGWVPTAALRHVYKKEYPKFLRTFTEYVLKNVKGKPVAI
ncbi:unnamed protein product [Caenorhabditis auriculariae]|uniref:START domain-containing protein n=1 Tax=Caenorhabditis auriculariae TaxID=2777116 RepID=A0A8S1HLV4_9PELO|nr:unnamed protein product [Caenorhabditis auriculariae]